MALRDAIDSGGKTTAGRSSAMAGLRSYWDVAECPPKTEWEKWFAAMGFVFDCGKPEIFNLSSRVNKSTDGTPTPSTAFLINFLLSCGEENHQHSVPWIIGKEEFEQTRYHTQN